MSEGTVPPSSGPPPQGHQPPWADAAQGIPPQGSPGAVSPDTSETGSAAPGGQVPPTAPWQYDPTTGQPIQAAGATNVAPSIWCSLVAIAALALAVSLNENGSNAWEHQAAWSVFALVCATVTFVPAMRASFKIDERRAWQIGAAGAIGLGVYWVLIVLPAISLNLSFLATVGCAAGGLAAWLSPGRPEAPSQ